MQTVHNPYLEFIKCQFDEIDQTIQTRNKRGYFDTPKKCEDLFCQLLNIMFDWQLINLNRAKHNVPAIDLGDLEHKVCVQVTSCRDKCKKLKQTIMAFDKHHLQTQYNKLLFFMIAWEGLEEEKQAAPKNVALVPWCLRDLFSHIQTLPAKKQKACADCIHAFIQDGLLLEVDPEVRGKEFHLEKTVLEGPFQTYFAYGLGSVRLDAFLPVFYDDTLSCLILFREVKLCDNQITLEEPEIVERLFKNRETGVSLDRGFIVAIKNGEVLVQLGNNRFILTSTPHKHCRN